jgi:ferredoxin
MISRTPTAPSSWSKMGNAWLMDGPGGLRAEIGEDCQGCGRCAEVCPNGAIQINIEGGKYVKQTIERIAPLVELG